MSIASSANDTADVTLTKGNLVIGSAGNGITFGGDPDGRESSATAGSRTLYDYEEGTWQPAIVSSSYGGVTALSGSGTYTKIGKQVTVYASLTSFTGKNANQFFVGGLPFTPETASQYMMGVAESDGGRIGLVRTDATNPNLLFYRGAGTGGWTRTSYQGNDLGNGMRLSLTYFYNIKMALTKQTITDKIESVRVQDHYVLQVREAIQVLEDGQNLLSQNYHRYVLQPDEDTSTITDPVVLAQFNAVMTQEVKDNYQTFLASQQPVTEE